MAIPASGVVFRLATCSAVAAPATRSLARAGHGGGRLAIMGRPVLPPARHARRKRHPEVATFFAGRDSRTESIMKATQVGGRRLPSVE